MSIWCHFAKAREKVVGLMSSLAKNFSRGSLNWFNTLLLRLIFTINSVGLSSTFLSCSTTNSRYQNLLASSRLNTNAAFPLSSILNYDEKCPSLHSLLSFKNNHVAIAPLFVYRLASWTIPLANLNCKSLISLHLDGILSTTSWSSIVDQLFLNPPTDMD